MFAQTDTPRSQALEGLIPPEGMQPLAAAQLSSKPQIRFFLKDACRFLCSPYSLFVLIKNVFSKISILKQT